MRARSLLLAALLLPVIAGAQERLALDALGELELAWATVEAMEQVPGPALRATADPGPGAALQLRLPAELQRADFRVRPGARVTAGDPLAVLEGLEIHHWMLEYEALETRFDTARRRYERNQSLFREGALSGDRWTEIEERYFALQLEFEHMRHVREWLQPGPQEIPDSLLAIAPASGWLLYDSRNVMFEAGATLFEILPQDELRLRVMVPTDRAAQIEALAFDDCEVAVAWVEESAHGFYRTAWSRPLTDACPLRPGAELGVRPLYRAQALRVPRDAVFQWRREPHVWLRQADSLVARPVELIADTPDGYAVADDPTLAGGEVLTRSVSAAQGILLGLGGS